MGTPVLHAALAAFAALAMIAPVGCKGGAPPPASPTADDVFAAIKARDAARLGAVLDASPILASARRKDDGASAVLVALFQINPDHETFSAAQANPLLAAVVAHRPTLDVFDAAAVGDVARLTAILDQDPSQTTAFHAAFGTTPLHLAAFAGAIPAMELLLARGAVVDAVSRNKFRNTPLVVTTLTSQREAAALLLAKGADPNVPEDGGFRALHIAAEAGDAPMIRLLLDHGAVAAAKADDGSTALDIAKKRQRAEASALLAARGG
jgi:hypothetical protein